MPPQDSEVTRSKLLQAAGEVFAERGYRDATIREICERAGTNIAAINYHFRGKDELYAAVLEVHFEASAVAYPIPQGASMTPEAALHEFVVLTVERMLNESKPAWHAKLTGKEIADPTPHLDLVADRFMKPHFRNLRSIIDSLTPGVPEDRRRLLALSVMGQIVFYLMCRNAIARITPEQGLGPNDRQLIARHITEVTLAAAKDLRNANTSTES